MNEKEMFEAWWSRHQDETWEATLTAQERAEGKTRSPIWGNSFKRDAKLAWMARAELAANAESRGTARHETT
jgi:hypothetical protein